MRVIACTGKSTAFTLHFTIDSIVVLNTYIIQNRFQSLLKQCSNLITIPSMTINLSSKCSKCVIDLSICCYCFEKYDSCKSSNFIASHPMDQFRRLINNGIRNNTFIWWYPPRINIICRRSKMLTKWIE